MNVEVAVQGPTSLIVFIGLCGRKATYEEEEEAQSSRSGLQMEVKLGSHQ